MVINRSPEKRIFSLFFTSFHWSSFFSYQLPFTFPSCIVCHLFENSFFAQVPIFLLETFLSGSFVHLRRNRFYVIVIYRLELLYCGSGGSSSCQFRVHLLSVAQSLLFVFTFEELCNTQISACVSGKLYVSCTVCWPSLSSGSFHHAGSRMEMRPSVVWLWKSYRHRRSFSLKRTTLSTIKMFQVNFISRSLTTHDSRTKNVSK